MNYKPVYLAIAVVLMTCMMQVSQAKSAEEYFDRPVRLAAVSLSVKTIKDIYRWWNDEISGGECGKNFFKNSAESGGFIAGSYIGAVIASKYLFPWIPDAATFIGECVGGLFGMEMTHYLIDSLTNNSPKGEVLKEAYKFLQLEENVSISEINQSFFRLVNKFKLGTDNFQKLQFYMQVIRISKGESF